MKETELFEPIKNFLEKQGYEVRGEVMACDIAARKDDELVVVELKTKFSLSLVLQAVKRQEVSDSVYVAVPVPARKRYIPNFRSIVKLLRRLELGLIQVYFLKRKTRVEVLLQPTPYSKRRNKKRRLSIIREIDGRYKNFNKGGSRATDEKITAYKQSAIEIACYLDILGEASPAALRKLGTGNKTNSILSMNFYGWFERVCKGVYILHPQGKKAMGNYPEIVEHFKKHFKELQKKK